MRTDLLFAKVQGCLRNASGDGEKCPCSRVNQGQGAQEFSGWSITARPSTMIPAGLFDGDVLACGKDQVRIHPPQTVVHPCGSIRTPLVKTADSGAAFPNLQLRRSDVTLVERGVAPIIAVIHGLASQPQAPMMRIRQRRFSQQRNPCSRTAERVEVGKCLASNERGRRQ